MGIRDNVKKLILPIIGGGAPAARPTPPARPTGASAASSPPPREPAARPPAPPRDPRFSPPPSRGDKPAAAFVEEAVKAAPVVLFMKGSPLSPQCGFSAGAAGILTQYGVKLSHVDVLADPEVREAVKQFTSWPTIPQVFIGGEFVGGADILKELHDSGELKAMIEAATASPAGAGAAEA